MKSTKCAIALCSVLVVVNLTACGRALNNTWRKMSPPSAPSQLPPASAPAQLPTLSQADTQKLDKLSRAAIAAAKNRDYAAALKLNQDGLKAAEELKHDGWRSYFIAYIGDNYEELHRNKESLEFRLQALEMDAEFDDNPDRPALLWGVGRSYSRLRQWDLALDYYSKALKLSESLGDEKRAAGVLRDIGSMFRNQDQYDTALEYQLRALKLREKLGDKRDVAAGLDGVAAAYFSLSRYGEALDYHSRALVINQKIGFDRGSAFSMAGVSVADAHLGNHETALKLRNASLKIFENLHDRELTASGLNNLAWLYAEMGRYRSAEECARKADQMNQTMGEDADPSQLPEVLAYLSRRAGRYDQAIQYAQKSLSVNPDPKRKRAIYSELCSEGYAYNRMGKYQMALDRFKEALTYCAEIHAIEGAATCNYGIGVSLAGLNDLDGAMNSGKQALQARKRIKSPVTIADSLNSLGDICAKKGRTTEALDYHRQALALFQKLGNYQDIAETLGNIASDYQKLNDSGNASLYLRQAASARNKAAVQNGM